MLLLLRKRGPSTEGVFRKSGNSKNIKEFKEKLNSGLEVDFESQAVSLLTGLLKVSFHVVVYDTAQTDTAAFALNKLHLQLSYSNHHHYYHNRTYYHWVCAAALATMLHHNYSESEGVQ